MAILFDMLVIVSVTLWVLDMALQKQASEAIAAILLVAVVAIVAMARAVHSRVFRLVCRIGFVAVSVILFALRYGYDMRSLQAIAVPLVTLFILLLGIYLMVSGFFRTRR
jgi:hypothetical protein